jgi:flagellar hook-length control protein FliK
MTAVSAPLPAAGPAAPSSAAGLAGNNGNTDSLPADFASMLKALSQAAGGTGPELSARSAPDPGLAAVLNELQAAFGDKSDAEDADAPVDIALILGQINAQAAIPALSPAAAADAVAREVGKDAAGQAGRGQEVPSALLPTKLADDPTGMLKKDLTETKAEFSLEERPAADHASLRAGEVGSARGPHAERAKLEVATPVHSPNWSAEVGQRVVWMARNNVQEAQLSVNPPHLGPIEITLSLKDDAATARFFSPHAEVREILEQALPRLREMLAGAGVQLGQSDVGAQSQQAFQQFSGRHPGAGNGQASFSEEHPSLHGLNAVKQTAVVRTLTGNGLVDTFV